MRKRNITKPKEYEIVRPKTHEGWLEERKKGIGASEAGVILGVSKYRTPYQLWRQKVGLDPGTPETWAMVQGHLMEPQIATWFAQETGLETIKASKGDWLAVDVKQPHLRVSPDITYWATGRKKAGDRGILEAKSSRNEITIDNWRTEHLDWFCQIQYQLHVMRLQHGCLGFVNTLTGDHFFDFVEYDKGFCEGTLIPAITDYYEQHVKPAHDSLQRLYDRGKGKYTMEQIMAHPRYSELVHEWAPTVVDASDTALRYPCHVEGKSAEYTGEDFAERYATYRRNKEAMKVLDEKCKRFEADVKTTIMDAENLVDGCGNLLATWKANKSGKKFDEARFRAEHGDLYESYVTEKPGARVLRFK